MDLEGLLTMKELAAYLNVSVSTIKDWRGRGEGPPALRVGGSLRWRREDIEAWLNENAERPS
jgi:excisionase family DNA binding protein